jgi:hypothetical protein
MWRPREAEPPGSPRFGAGAAVAVAAAFLALGLAFTFPLVAHLADGLPFAAVPAEGRELLWRVQGDHLQFYYYLWLVRDRLLEGASFLRDPYQFAVNGPRLNLPNTFLPFAVPYVALSAFGPRLAYNLLVLLSFPLAGLPLALLLHRYGLGRVAAVAGGAVFACLPYRVGVLLGGHPAGLSFGLVPLTLWGLEAALAGSIAGGVWCAAALVSLSIMEPHYFYFAMLGLPLYLLARLGLPGVGRATLRVGALAWTLAVVVAGGGAAAALVILAERQWTPPWPQRLAVAALVGAGVLAAWQAVAGWLAAGGWRALGSRRPVAALGIAAAGGLAGVVFMMVLRQALLRRSVSGAGRTLSEVLLFSPLPADLLVRANPNAARAIYLGVAALALAALGAVALALRPPPPRARVLWVFPPLLVLGTALSLGPRLTSLPLFDAAFQLVPFWNFVRQPAKFQVLVGLALAVLAGVGAAAVGRAVAGRHPAWRVALPLGLVAIVLAEYHPWRPAGVSLVPTGGASYEAMRAIGPRALWVPFWPGDSAWSGLYLYATTLTRVSMLNGYSAWLDRRYISDVYRALERVNLGVVGEAEYAVLRRYGVRQVILDHAAFPLKVSPFGPAFTLAGLRHSPFLELAHAPAGEDPLWVFRVREQPGPSGGDEPRSPLGVYWEAESLRRETGELVEDAEASNGRAVAARAGRDRPGFVAFGPYRLMPAGPFRALFRVRGEASGVRLEVTAEGGRRVLGSRSLRLASGPAFEEAPVDFALDAPAFVEYRVQWDGTGRRGRRRRGRRLRRRPGARGGARGRSAGPRAGGAAGPRRQRRPRGPRRPGADSARCRVERAAAAVPGRTLPSLGPAQARPPGSGPAGVVRGPVRLPRAGRGRPRAVRRGGAGRGPLRRAGGAVHPRPADRRGIPLRVSRHGRRVVRSAAHRGPAAVRRRPPHRVVI